MSAHIQGIKYAWRLPSGPSDKALTLASRFNLSQAIIQTLLSRNFQSEDDIERFLFSIKERDVAHPSLLKDAEKAIERIIYAIKNEEKILICGDYDVDGITSSSLMLTCLLPLGAKINFFLPHRVRDGYGLSVKTIERAHKNNYKVIITVDNGITAFEPAFEAKRRGIDLIITDHHRPHDKVPDAYAIINPHQHDCPYPYKNFAGVGVGFKVMSLLYEKLGLPLPNEVYELLLLGTIADVVPLTGENRFWVRHGLQLLKKYESTAFQVLKKNGRLTKPIVSSQDIGFFITPQINALGRLDDARDGVKFLMSVDALEVERIGSVLASLNDARKAIEKEILKDIEEKVKHIDLTTSGLIVASSSKWAPGVIGLAASRIVSNYHRPTFLFCTTSEGIAKGSCRSIPAFNVFNALSEVKDILITFGGHAAAAGLSLPAHKLDEFKERMQAVIDKQLVAEDFKATIQLDAELALRDVTSKLLYDLAYLEPFGCANTVPLFYLKNVSIVGEPQLLKESHVKCTLFADGIIKPVIFFNRPDLFTKVKEMVHQTCEVAVHVIENSWNNESKVELQGIDLR